MSCIGLEISHSREILRYAQNDNIREILHYAQNDIKEIKNAAPSLPCDFKGAAW